MIAHSATALAGLVQLGDVAGADPLTRQRIAEAERIQLEHWHAISAIFSSG